MKIDHVDIGEGVYMGAAQRRAVQRAGAATARASAPLTLVMKGEAIPADTGWQGCPAAPARG